MCRETFGLHHECGHVAKRDFLYCDRSTTIHAMSVYAEGPNRQLVCDTLGKPDYHITNPARCDRCEELRKQAFERLARADPSYRPTGFSGEQQVNARSGNDDWVLTWTDRHGMR